MGRNAPDFFAPKRNFHGCSKVVGPLTSGVGQIRAMASDSTGAKPGSEAGPVKQAIGLKEHKFEHKVSGKFWFGQVVGCWLLIRVENRIRIEN